jgi:predicted acyl esterase
MHDRTRALDNDRGFAVSTENRVEPFEIEVRTRRGIAVRADAYLPSGGSGTLFCSAHRLIRNPSGGSPRIGISLSSRPGRLSFIWIEATPTHGPMSLEADAQTDLGEDPSEGNGDAGTREEAEALHDVIEWIAAQEYSTGKIGRTGQSYPCWSQWNAARTRPPHLTTIIAHDGAVDIYRDWMCQAGKPAHLFPLVWIVGGGNAAAPNRTACHLWRKPIQVPR